MRWRVPLTMLVATFVIVGCDHEPLQPTTEPVAESPGFDFMNGPEHTGMVWRWQSAWFPLRYFEETPADPWYLIIGIKQEDVPKDCGGPGTSEPLNIHEVWFDETFRSIQNATRKDATVLAYDADEFEQAWDDGGFCAAFFLEPIAEGIADHHFNDNDAFGVRDHNVWSERANGHIWYEGERYKLHFSGHWYWNVSLDEPFGQRVTAWIK